MQVWKHGTKCGLQNEFNWNQIEWNISDADVGFGRCMKDCFFK